MVKPMYATVREYFVPAAACNTGHKETSVVSMFISRSAHHNLWSIGIVGCCYTERCSLQQGGGRGRGGTQNPQRDLVSRPLAISSIGIPGCCYTERCSLQQGSGRGVVPKTLKETLSEDHL